ncbi:MAG: primosomal protein N' [Candidatus Krumholzibacteria bacterium]|nr:primosomal protein N' [Candidatus Krumholzibacteria bacterium]
MTPRKSPISLVDVALPLPVDRLFTYRIPEALAGTIGRGARVVVPFGARRITGYVICERNRAPAGMRLKEIISLVDKEPLLGEVLLELADWMAGRYVHSLGEVLKAMLPAGIKGRGRLREEKDAFPPELEFPVLEPDQRKAVDEITGAVRRQEKNRFLLHGVTGSGKTEVYLRCIGEVLERGGSALVLIPEIALIPQTTARFRRRFGTKVAVLHSRLTGPQRSVIWRGAADGDIRVVIGARSAVFVPLERLEIIVVDEEQDTSFKQEEKPHYNAVEVAGRRAEREGAVLLLGSATPSLETYASARKGDMGYLRLRSRPVGGKMPTVEIVDMRGRDELVSSELLDALETVQERGEQAIILLNRRGHANYVQCRKCGWIARCPNCSISLTYHSRGNELMCHYCGIERKPPEACPSCGAYRMIHRGVGTQRIELELGNLIPGLRVVRMDMDSTSGTGGHLRILEQFAKGEKDVLLGTQMVAKGHHYPDVTLVGVLSADDGLNFPDFRAAERTFRLLSQAAGRTGRGDRGGRVIVQTFTPDLFLFEYLVSHDYEGFAEQELEQRRELGYPPSGSVSLFTASARSEEVAHGAGEMLARSLAAALDPKTYSVLGPTEALVGRLRGRYRLHVLVKGGLDDGERKKLIASAKKALKESKGVDLRWDFDPVQFS